MAFHSDATLGGGVFSTTSAGSVTYTAANIVNSHLIVHNASGALTATLPTGALLSSAGFLPNAGDTKDLYIFASTTKITLAGSNGVLLFSASTTNVISASTTGRITFTRLDAADGRVIQALLVAD